MTKGGEDGKSAQHRDCLSPLSAPFFPPLLFMPASHLEDILAVIVRRDIVIREGGHEWDGQIKRAKDQERVSTWRDG